MKPRILLIALLIIFLAAACATKNFEWEVNNNGNVVITAYKGTALDVAIPKKIQGKPVAEIGESAFLGRSLTSVAIPKQVKIIRHRAFMYNELENIVIPQGVKMIGESAFSYNKLKSATLPNTLTRMESGAFAHNELESMVIPDSVTRIENKTFYENHLQNISLPENLVYIGVQAFAYNLISDVTLPESLTFIDSLAFANNPLKELNVKSNELRSVPRDVFDPEISTFLLPGTYILSDDEGWFFQAPDGARLSMQSYYDRLVADDEGALAIMAYNAIISLDMWLLRNAISLSADVKGLIYDRETRRDNTPLALLFANNWVNNSNPWNESGQLVEIITILLEAGAVPQNWMLYYTYHRPDITKMLLERGAFTNPVSPEYGSPPSSFASGASDSILLFYCRALQGRYDSGYGLNPAMAESAALLFEYGAVNYRDPQTGQTPLSLALKETEYGEKPLYGLEMAAFLVKHVSRPLSLEEYRLLIRANREKVYTMWRHQIEADRDYEDRHGFDALLIEDVRRGILNIDDILDYVIETGTAGLMQGLVPYLSKSKRPIIAANETGLYFDALNAGNPRVAAVLSNAMNHVFTAKDASGREYSREYYAYDYETIYRSAQRMPERSMYLNGPGGARQISDDQQEIDYSPNALFVLKNYAEGLQLHTAQGLNINLDTFINEARERHYRESGKNAPNDSNPGWYVARIFGNVLYAYNRVYWDEAKNEYCLIDISGSRPSVYILETENLAINSMTALYEPHTWISLLEDAMDFVIDSGRAHLIKGTGAVFIFAVKGRSLQFEKSVPYRECKIPGWKGGERVFLAGDTVEAYNFASGTARPLGKEVEIPYAHHTGRNYLYEDAQGRRFIVEANSGRAYPEPAEEYHYFTICEGGYIYTDEKQERFHHVCLFENGVLKRKLVLSGTAISDTSFSVYGNKIYLGMYGLAFTIDIKTMRLGTAFNTAYSGRNADIYVYMFPFGANDAAYTYTVDYGK